MSKTTVGGTSKPILKLDGKKVIVDNVFVYDGSVNMSYWKRTVYEFATTDMAMEYYYKKR